MINYISTHNMKKLIYILAAICITLASSGCATRAQTAILAGGVGMVIGSAMAQPNTVVVTQPMQEQVIIVNDSCQQFPTYNERAACSRGARQRYYEEQRKRENEAFRRGYGK